jgi:hypothetical protein
VQRAPVPIDTVGDPVTPESGLRAAQPGAAENGVLDRFETFRTDMGGVRVGPSVYFTQGRFPSLSAMPVEKSFQIRPFLLAGCEKVFQTVI